MRMMRSILFLILWGLAFYVQADGGIDLDGDGVKDSYSISAADDEGSATLDIVLSGSGKKFSGTFDFGSGGLVPGYVYPGFDLLLDFYTHNTTLTKYGFRWSAELSDWVLYKISTWQEPSRDEQYSIEGKIVPEYEIMPRNFEVVRVECCVKFTDFSKGSPFNKKMSKVDAAGEILKDFSIVSKGLSKGESGPLFYTVGESGAPEKIVFPVELAYELSTVVNKDNVRGLNDLSYYLDKQGQSSSAALILAAILKVFPDRVVAKLNLADAYWDLNMPKAACPVYKAYVTQMNEENKSVLIPARASERSKCAG